MVRKRIGETEQDVILRQAREREERSVRTRAAGRVEGQATNAAGEVIRTPEQQKIFNIEAKKRQGEEPRAAQIADLAGREPLAKFDDPAAFQKQQEIANAPVPEVTRAPLEIGKEVLQAGIESQKPSFLAEALLPQGAFAQATAATKFLEIATADQLRARGFTELDIQMLDAGEGKISKLGQIISGLPGGFGRKRIGGLSLSDFVGTSPTTKTNELIKGIKENSDTIATALEMYAKTGNKAWLDQAERSKNLILQSESKIKILSIQNSEMLAQPEIATNVMTDIQNTKLLYPELNWFS